MPIPVLSAILLIFIIWLQYEIRKSSKDAKRNSDRFWDLENKSNHSRRKDISNLNYIKLSPEALPLDDKEDSTINSYRDTILKLADKRILNLSGISNTELKNEYGIANINLLMDYDNNFVILVSILHKWAERLYSEGFTQDAIKVLEYAVVCRTDVNKSYRLLAEIYKKNSTPEKINDLIPVIRELIIHDKDQLLNDLKEAIIS